MFLIEMATLGYTVYHAETHPDQIGTDLGCRRGAAGQEGRVVTGNGAAGQEHVLCVQRQLPEKGWQVQPSLVC